MQEEETCGMLSDVLPLQREKGSPVNPGKQAQSNRPSVELPLKH